MTGTLPTPARGRGVPGRPVARQEGGRRSTSCSARPTYAAWWTTKLCDITGNSPRHFKDQAPPEEYARHWYEWIDRRVRENVPYDELVAGIVLGRSRQPGQSYETYIKEQSAYYRDKDPADFTARETMPYYWAKQNTRMPEEQALNFSYAFLGVRLECAQCHKHPFDQWTQDDFNQFTAFFDADRLRHRPRREEGLPGADHQGSAIAATRRSGSAPGSAGLRRGRSSPGRKSSSSATRHPGREGEGGQGAGSRHAQGARRRGGRPRTGVDDPRRPLMEWMRRKDNPYFARAFVNRVWANYFGVGIINPPDDMNLANPPSNAALLDYLADGFVDHGFDMKWLHREIATARPTSGAGRRTRRTGSTSGTSAGPSSAACPPRCCSTRWLRRPPARPSWPGRRPTSRTVRSGPRGRPGRPPRP